MDHNIAPLRITGKGFGSNLPAAPNDCEANRSRNRRVEIIVVEELRSGNFPVFKKSLQKICLSVSYNLTLSI
jgi:hypothetical protein